MSIVNVLAVVVSGAVEMKIIPLLAAHAEHGEVTSLRAASALFSASVCDSLCSPGFDKEMMN